MSGRIGRLGRYGNISERVDRLTLRVNNLAVEEWSAVGDTFAGRVHVEWDSGGAGDAARAVAVLHRVSEAGGLFDGWVADCPLIFTSPNAPRKRDCWAPCCCRCWLGTAAMPISRRCGATR